jgi:hypothetical protein
MMTSANFSVLKGANWRATRWTLAPHAWLGYAGVVIAKLKVLASYAAIELILPGGSVMVIALWVYRRRKNGVGFGRFPLRLLSLLTSWSTYARTRGPAPFGTL